MIKHTDYQAIKLWGKQLGSFDYYIVSEQHKAKRDGAPIDAIYQSEGAWRCVSDLPVDHPFRAHFKEKAK